MNGYFSSSNRAFRISHHQFSAVTLCRCTESNNLVWDVLKLPVVSWICRRAHVTFWDLLIPVVYYGMCWFRWLYTADSYWVNIWKVRKIGKWNKCSALAEMSDRLARKILNNPDNPLFDLLPPPRDAAIIGRLRSAHLLPVLRTRTSKCRSFIHHHYQPKSKWIISN